MATAGRLDAGRRVAGKLAPAKIDFFYDVARSVLRVVKRESGLLLLFEEESERS